MEDNWCINLSNCVVGPNQLDRLLKEWQKDPQPKTISELARAYLTNRIEDEKGYLPYDRRRSYKEGDKIAIYADENVHPAQIIKVIKSYDRDSEGLSYDAIDLVLLDRIPAFSHLETRSFLANYQGEELAGPGVRSFEIIKEEDEKKLTPKILTAISKDKRFIGFGEYWLPSDCLIYELSGKIGDVRKTIAKSKQPLSTEDILEELHAGESKQDLYARLEFTLNHFLEQDRRFIRIPGEITKWDLRKPFGPVLLTIGQRTLCDGKLSTNSDLDLLLFYHGFTDQCVFSFPYDRKIGAYHDISEGTIYGEEFVNELAKLSENREYKVNFRHPENRGDPIWVSALDEPEKIESTVTVRQEWLADGVLRVPKRLSSYMKGTKVVNIIYDQIEEELPYDEGDKLIKGLNEFYSKKAIAEYDKVQLQLESLRPIRLFIHSSWKVSLIKLLQIEPQDLQWQQSSLRDCIIVVFGKFRTAAHYREIYPEIAAHKQVALGSIISTLSKYSPSVFVHVCRGKWGLAGWEKQKELPNSEPQERIDIIEIGSEVWEAVATIEEKDYVYKLLEKIKSPLSFDEICSRLADYLKVDVCELRATGFLKADDERFRRQDDGTWALEEWFTRDEPQEKPAEGSAAEAVVQETPSEKSSKSGLFWLLVIIFLILLLICTAICLFVYGR